MAAHLRAISTIATVLMLAACAANNAGLRQQSAASQAQNSACLNQTGSRIADRPANCMEFGRSYSNDDVKRTGYVVTGDALRHLDPAVH